MRASTRARYGLRALLYLAEQNPLEVISVRRIAEMENVSADYLEHLLHSIKKAGLVESIRGAAGGFRLARPTKEITLKDIFEALDERMDLVWCLGEGDNCPRSGECRSRPMWDRFGELVQKFLSDTTLADAVNSSGR